MNYFISLSVYRINGECRNLSARRTKSNGHCTSFRLRPGCFYFSHENATVYGKFITLGISMRHDGSSITRGTWCFLVGIGLSLVANISFAVLCSSLTSAQLCNISNASTCITSCVINYAGSAIVDPSTYNAYMMTCPANYVVARVDYLYGATASSPYAPSAFTGNFPGVVNLQNGGYQCYWGNKVSYDSTTQGMIGEVTDLPTGPMFVVGYTTYSAGCTPHYCCAPHGTGCNPNGWAYGICYDWGNITPNSCPGAYHSCWAYNSGCVARYVNTGYPYICSGSTIPSPSLTAPFRAICNWVGPKWQQGTTVNPSCSIPSGSIGSLQVCPPSPAIPMQLVPGTS